MAQAATRTTGGVTAAGTADERTQRTIREAAFELFRARGMTTIFGNPGSTELPMLSDFPSDFTYVLGLQEAVVVGMADGFAQASGRPTHVNLHTAPGVGNAMGAIFNAQANKSPLLITAGQQVRAHITMQANLTNRDATRVPLPFVKWSYEPPRAQDVVAGLARAIHHATLPPKGPAFVSLPMDDIVVLESPTSTLALRNRLRISRPGSYYFCAGGGLGYGLAAGIGVQLAQPDRPVVCVLGEGSAQYAISGLWTAVAYEVPVTFLVLRNEEYGILKWFADIEQVTGAPGLDLPALDTAEIARAYGVS